MLSQLDKMSGLIVTRLHPVGWVCSRVPCGNRFSTSQGTVPPVTYTLLSLGYTQWDGCVVEFPCGNRFSTSQGTVSPITDTLMYLEALLSL